MDYNKDSISNAFREFWKKNKGNMKYFIKGDEVVPKSVSYFSLQLQEGDFGDGYNFRCDTLNLRADIDGKECPYDAEFVMKVSYIIDGKGSKPVEIIDSIKDNRISLKRK